ncbi:hypothetical protein ACEZCY_25635 [Streptacidiphilus sp. N1-12]|uniref:Uncharacterized protein n=2 Tax=Streptacidiphilus alkalitolerans TaxID=3342712 RepID=A0ABV6V7D4_9ACTN
MTAAPPSETPPHESPHRESPHRENPPHENPPREHPRGYLTPECRVGRVDTDFRHGCPSCQAPGYYHPVLGWMPVPCECDCHSEEESTP